jgi:hypothetical protein
MRPRFVKPYRKSDKNDANDAAAICEAVTRASMRFVPIKSERSMRLGQKRSFVAMAATPQYTCAPLSFHPAAGASLWTSFSIPTHTAGM